MRNLSAILHFDREISESIAALSTELSNKKPQPVLINGLTGGATYLYLAECIRKAKEKTEAPSLILVSSETERERVADELNKLGILALTFKSRDLIFHNISASHDIERERLSVLSSILSSNADVIVSTASAALAYTIPRSFLRSLFVHLSVGEEVDLRELSARLSSLGYASVDSVESTGQFSKRGGIIDLWTNADNEPVRIEFFGDEIDRMSYFDPSTQRTDGACDEITLLPANEVLLDKDARERVKYTVNSLISKSKSDDSREKLRAEMAVLDASLSVDFRDKYLGIIYNENENLLSYVSEKGRVPVFVLDTNGCMDELKKSLASLNSQRTAMLECGLVNEKAAKYSASESDLSEFFSVNTVFHINSFSSGLGTMNVSGIFGFRCRRSVSYGGNFSMLTEDLRSFIKSGYRTLIFSENIQGAESLLTGLDDIGIHAVPIFNNPNFDFSSAAPGSVLLDVGSEEGFELITPKIAVLSMAQDEGRRIMQNRRRQRIIKKAGGAGQRLMSYADLTVGDYVVHSNYGIGLFEGMQTVTVEGVTKDYITIRYAGTDKLFVPCDRLEYIGKYIGEKDKDGKVKLSKMGGGDWTRTKTRAKAAAKDIAKDLLRLYAERQRKPGFAFSEDTDLEDEFASGFDYEETSSQLCAIEEIKADMMRPVPMNRLLCGDVGFGKTEVALRAAFKAIVNGKQVALLVPTTILALQHFGTAVSRMRGFPVTVEMISRFRTPKEQEKILRRTKRGEIDLLIGTHKLLSKNVEFRDLGLLIIDEEQRFGVSQKEKLKEMASNIDVLTLSATPIPRTLNMAMNGISDMSILDEAPGDRRPVQTYVLEYDEATLNDAIKRELSRGGQVLYLYNKVEDIAYRADKIMRDIPNSRVAYAHGKMERDELEDIWQMLVRAEIDVLVCTTIIETGVDLPNANTLIIENADRMGLSQLHQIRGRVGRSSRQAYAYFTYRRGKALSEIATKRLLAIREFAEFGAGFKVALRDLEIRGAGNLLGAEQHGYIDSVGYDLYVKLLSEAVLEEKGEIKEAGFECAVDIKINAHIPESYIPVSSQRMEMYKKISLIGNREDKEDILDEFIDRFGEPPKATLSLLSISLVRDFASKAKIKKIEYRETTLTFVAENLDLGIWSELFEKYAGLSFRAGVMPVVIYKTKNAESAVSFCEGLLEDYLKLMNENKEVVKDESKQ